MIYFYEKNYLLALKPQRFHVNISKGHLVSRYDLLQHFFLTIYKTY